MESAKSGQEGQVQAVATWLYALAHNKVMSLPDYDIYTYKKVGKIITIVM
jgi:hypothetical protein